MQSSKADDGKYRTTSPYAPSLMRPANTGNPACLATSGQLIADRAGARPDHPMSGQSCCDEQQRRAPVGAEERSRDRGDPPYQNVTGWIQRWPSVRGHFVLEESLFVLEESLGECAGVTRQPPSLSKSGSRSVRF